MEVQQEETINLESARRRTFAIISHPDAGKTTLTEKFLLYSGAVSEAGSVKARNGRRSATSDWMALEKQRGISITSTVLQFNYRDCVFNLLDTPGHRDFSEDTYRVLAAADAAIMVLDVAKGIEAQTLKLFEVCRSRNLPIITFINKYDRPGREPLSLLDEIEEQIGLKPTPVTWGVGIPGDFKGVLDRRTGEFIRFRRSSHGSTEALEERLSPERALIEVGDAWTDAQDECALLDEVGANINVKKFLVGEESLLYIGSALTNFGVSSILDALMEYAPSPEPRIDLTGKPRPLGAPFSGFVFKVQANMDPSHRDHIAFIRVCSGRFERGMTLIHGPSGRPFSTKYATSVFGSDRETIDLAYPGDIIGLVNASGLRIGDTLYEDGEVEFPGIPTFVPELFASVSARDTGRYKQFHRGLSQMEQEGVVQILRDPQGDNAPMLAAVGQMQFEVFAYRLENEFGAKVDISINSYKHVVRTDRPTAEMLRGLRGVKVVVRRDDVLLALFESEYWLDKVRSDHPNWRLENLAVISGSQDS